MHSGSLRRPNQNKNACNVALFTFALYSSGYDDPTAEYKLVKVLLRSDEIRYNGRCDHANVFESGGRYFLAPPYSLNQTLVPINVDLDNSREKIVTLQEELKNLLPKNTKLPVTDIQLQSLESKLQDIKNEKERFDMLQKARSSCYENCLGHDIGETEYIQHAFDAEQLAIVVLNDYVTNLLKSSLWEGIERNNGGVQKIQTCRPPSYEAVYVPFLFEYTLFACERME